MCVPFTSYEAMKTLIPLPRRLLQSIQRFLQLAYHMLISCSFEPHWLRHIDLLIKIVIEKCGLHIKLVKVQLICATSASKIRIDECFTAGENTSL